ncbi:MAG: hypothetical protein EOO20_19830, partial [Chryseobacterium sp.]
MSVELISAPPALCFSGDQITAVFSCTNVFAQNGVKAINKLVLPDPIAVGTQLVFFYGGKTVTMVAALAPDESGHQFTATPFLGVYPEVQVENFKSNYQLSQDFDMTVNGGEIVFTAKAFGTSYNFNTGPYIANYVPGTIQTLRPNYGIAVRLFCETADHSSFEMIWESMLNVKISQQNTAEAPLGDKLHTYITDHIRNNLPDIPDISTLNCKKSCRRYYFEYAESYGETVQVRKVFKSEVKTVIHGRLSAIGQAYKSVGALLAPGNDFKRFLKQGGKISSTRSDQKQYLYYFNSQGTFQAKILCRLRFTDGTKFLKVLDSVEMLQHRKYAVDVSSSRVCSDLELEERTLLAYE